MGNQITGSEETGQEMTPGTADELAARLAEAVAELAEARETLLREHAEIENQRKRLHRDLEQARRFTNERLLADLLPVCDSLQRGVAMQDTDVTALHKGMALTLKELNKMMASHGLVEIDPQGEPFDADRHQAMNMVDAPNTEPNTVVGVLQKGYMLNERLLRPALVSVAREADDA